MERHVWFCMVFLLLTFVSSTLGQLKNGQIKSVVKEDEKGCIYNIRTQTSDKRNAGTDATVRMTLCSWRNKCFLDIADLSQYGDRGPNYNRYFDRAAFSHFQITTTDWCEPTCLVLVAHDGQDRRDRWSVDYMQVEALNTYGTQKYYNSFPIYGTLDVGETVTVDKCPVSLGDDKYLDVEAQGSTRVFPSSLPRKVINA